MATLKRGKFWQISGPCKCKGGTVLKCVLTGREYQCMCTVVHVYTLMYMYCMYKHMTHLRLSQSGKRDEEEKNNKREKWETL